MRRKLAPRRRPKPRARPAIQTVIDETIGLYQWLAWVAEELYGDDARGAARRWTLRRLSLDGPLTVPALARVRAVRRQSLQPLVDQLAEEGLVEWVDNPAHRRSPLVRLTNSGEELVARLDRIDRAVLRSVSRGIEEAELQRVATTLRTLRAAFESKMRWTPAASAARSP